MIPCAVVDMSFFETAPVVYQCEQQISTSAENVFASFEGAEDWPNWMGPVRKIEWLAPQAFGVGTRRVVYLLGGWVGYSELIAWEKGKEMAFCFTHASKVVMLSLAERYQVLSCSEHSCILRWTVALSPRNRLFRRLFPLCTPVVRLMLRKRLRRLRDLLENRHLEMTTR